MPVPLSRLSFLMQSMMQRIMFHPLRQKLVSKSHSLFALQLKTTCFVITLFPNKPCDCIVVLDYHWVKTNHSCSASHNCQHILPKQFRVHNDAVMRISDSIVLLGYPPTSQ